jgi:hypothetical protein
MWNRCARACWGLVLLCSLPAASQDTPKDPFRGDSRLLQKVAVRAEGLSLDDLFILLSRKTGIELSASRDTGEEKVLLFGPARPLRELLADLAALLNDRWERKTTTGGGTRYVLARDLRARQYEARLVHATVERLMAKLDEQVRALAETPEQLARRPEHDPIRVFLSEDAMGRVGTIFYAALSRAQREALFARRRLDIPFAALSPEQQEPLRKAFAERIAAEQEFFKQNPELLAGRPVPVRKPEELEKGTLRFRVQPTGGFVSVGINMGRLPMLAQVTVDEAGRTAYSTSGWPITLLDSRTGWLLPPHGNPYTRAPVPGDASLPAVGYPPERSEGRVPARGAAAEKAWPDRLRRLAEASGAAVMADYYRGKPLARPPDAADPTRPADAPTAALDALCQRDGYLWWMRGKTLLLRKRDWYQQRLYEVSDRWMLALIERLKIQSGIPSYADVARVLELTTDQIVDLNSLQGGSYVDEPELLAGLPELLAIVNASPKGLTTPLTTGSPTAEGLERSTLTYRVLTPRQRALLPAFLEAQDPPLPEAEVMAFSARLFCPSDKPQSNGTGYLSVPVRVEWSFGEASSRRHFTLFLPASLPDDRRGRTRIEVVP